MTRLYPRSTLRRIILAHEPTMSLSKNVDIELYVLYQLFLHRLITEASRQAQLTHDSIIQSRHVSRALKVVLQQFKG
ncbi:centromere protein W [Lobosporangium transversale]|uniref:Centromere protein W n=1 Tax=Lobosporangium transversale TaxID=64571 RepID=A0A1Y2G7W7_9FUNG|nr:centromere protein W [Lobosporangium transversale]ORZ01980.1 centromere protein W [Lobosporangium transversale]|eukprot:XP_021876233.1 centromere protein W [Lobosporangium transversale]